MKALLLILVAHLLAGAVALAGIVGIGGAPWLIALALGVALASALGACVEGRQVAEVGRRPPSRGADPGGREAPRRRVGERGR